MIKHRILIQNESILDENTNLELLKQSQGIVTSSDDREPSKYMDCAAVCAKKLHDLNDVPVGIYPVITDLNDLPGEDDSFNGARLIAKVEVARPTPNYSLNRSQHGSGFIFYAPDPVTISGFHIPALGIGLRQWLNQLDNDQIHGIWFDCPEAEEKGKGLELDILAIARQHFNGELWLSGGARQFRHIQNLVQEGNCDALVLSMDQFEKLGGQAIVHEMNPPERIQLSNVEPELV